LLKFFSAGKNVGVSHVKPHGRLASTVALEIFRGRHKVNVMINDSGSVSAFDFRCLDSDDLRIIKEADYVAVLNWAQNLSGTELATATFSYTRRRGRGMTFFDPSDPSLRRRHIKRLVRTVFRPEILDIASLNESEAVLIAKGLKTGFRGSAIQACEMIHEATGVRMDLHTSSYSATIRDGMAVVVPCSRVRAKTVTGAGDAWNAGLIWADHLEFGPVDSLLLANIAAAQYVKTGTYATCEGLTKGLARILR